jgi:hypothetical protein
MVAAFLFWTLVKKDITKYRNMNNIFCILDSNTWEVYFNPNKIENKVITERLKFLKLEYDKKMPMTNDVEKRIVQEIHHIYDILTIILWTMNNTIFSKKII